MFKQLSKYQIIVVGLVCMMLLALSGCGSEKSQAPEKQAGFATIVDEAGRTVHLDKKPERIIPLSASYLEPLELLQAPVVARVSAKVGVPEASKKLPEVGNVYNLNIEKLLEYQPDLVIAYKGISDKYVQTLEANKIPVIVLDMRTYEQTKHTIDILGIITGKEAEAHKINQQMDDKIAAIKQKLPEGVHPSIAILHSTAQAVTVQLDNSIAGSVAQILGFKNVASGEKALEDNPTAAPYSMEKLVELNPEAIYVTTMGKKDAVKKSMMQNVESNPAWKTLAAVKAHKVYFLPQDMFLISPGTHYPEAVEMMAKELYPNIKF